MEEARDSEKKVESTKLAEMSRLVERLNAASAAYYNGMPELMTDHEWDGLFDRLKSLEEETGVVLEGSPTHRVSADDLAGQKEAHEYPALSLAKTKRPEELVKWADGRPVWISWKLDGLTLVVTYDDGRLARVVTRGDGHTGTNITHLARAIGGIAPTIPARGHVVVRGEAVISYEDFDRFLLESGEDYANPRNLASGSLTLKDPEEVRRRHIHWIPFTLVHTDEDITSWGARMDWLQQNGLDTVEHELVSRPTLDNVDAVISRWTARVTSRENPYPVDGLVMVYDDTAYAATGSVTGHHATRAGLAFKWQDESAQTTLDHVEWSCAASTISPVAVFQPVELEGTTVRRASLCNISECERLGIGGKGTGLEVIKANKIIPKVIRVTTKVGTLDIPTRCPVCGAQTEVVTSAASDTRTLHCSNAACPAKQLKKFARLVSKDGLDIDGISEQTLSRLINLGWVSEAADLYRLRPHMREMALLDGFGEKSASNLMNAVERSREADARHVLYALCIPLCGKDVCNRLLSVYPLAELMDKAAQTDNPEVFADIAGIGPEKSASVVRWFHDEANRAMADGLLQELHVSQADTTPQGNRCQGLTFVITGDVHHYKNRDELKAYIASEGGKVTGSVSRSTNFLINNDIHSTSGKNRKAQELGIPIISEDDFIKRFED